MINNNIFFVIFRNDGTIKLRGQTTSNEFLNANTSDGDVVHWGNAIAIAENSDSMGTINDTFNPI